MEGNLERQILYVTEKVSVREEERKKGSMSVSKREREREGDRGEEGEGLSDQEILWNLTRFENPFQMFKT